MATAGPSATLSSLICPSSLNLSFPLCSQLLASQAGSPVILAQQRTETASLGDRGLRQGPREGSQTNGFLWLPDLSCDSF